MMDAELLEKKTAADDAGKALTQRMKDNLFAIGQHRDPNAFQDFYDHFAGRIKSFLLGKGMQEAIAEELTQEIMLIVWRRAESYKPEKAAPSTWLFTIARNRRTDYLRGNSRIEVELDDEMLEVDDQAATQIEQVGLAQQSAELEKALTKLPPEQRQVLHLSYYRGQSHGAIAEWLDLPIGTVKSRIRLAMQSIRSELLAEEIQ